MSAPRRSELAAKVRTGDVVSKSVLLCLASHLDRGDHVLRHADIMAETEVNAKQYAVALLRLEFLGLFAEVADLDDGVRFTLNLGSVDR